MRWVHPTNKETEAQSDQMTCLESDNKVVEQG